MNLDSDLEDEITSDLQDGIGFLEHEIGIPQDEIGTPQNEIGMLPGWNWYSNSSLMMELSTNSDAWDEI